MRVDLFDFELPEARIALRPAQPRDAGRLLVVRPGGRPLLEDRTVRDLPGLLRPGDALVFNDTRVIPARLQALRTRPGAAGLRTEVMLHLREAPDRWRAFARPAKRLAAGDILRFGDHREGAPCELGRLTAHLVEKGEGGEIVLRFDLSGPILDERVAALGTLPLPPYIAGKRPADAQDAHDYQTVYATEPGAVAAPTAGLHFSEHLLAGIDAAGLSRHTVTLHVGAGTFLPVKADDTADHRMHAEIGRLDAETAEALNAVRARGGRIVAVGTTALRLLESAADGAGRLRAFAGPTDIFITPGVPVRAVDALMTNFHLPRSTLFMLVSAFSGLETMRTAYGHAIRAGYRFYSYGDSSLLFPDRRP
ncbi:tRNA preQ1(34) S-adenosylmethionine ribosyltransferase-isomerase QueA [Methylobacterium durans]|uniref:tRNA preQ1(34) S-adenosylmethionine ribosyltransferase-isomerase QueA n=1 Tax=Methylobacterium durans TaxID=2202825 RepID=UPI002AFF9E6D|nr:tRNA preQ1(34) S-adenosylmethionine ribosyltransferase-isomerase QueA [Methylobacterium durans]MEA1833511.1 tRNA preQ1(34) S-adenosylmethionine ribosyltransferase-isomerase QueA [Methylobacterium durans]